MNDRQSNAFAPANRLRVKAEFDYVFQRPNKRCSEGALQAIYKQSPESAVNTPRLGLVIAKRFLPLAVQRNRVKRLVRESFRRAQSSLPPVDIIIRLSRSPQNELNASDVAALFGKMQRP